MRRWFRRARWRKRRLRAVIGEGFLGLQGLRVPQLNPIGIWISSVIGNRLIPARDFFLDKEAKARAVLGLAEPVHPLPHLPRQSRLFGRRFRLHPPCGGRGMLFEYRAACSNPALALRMRAMGVAPRGAMMRCGRQMRRFEGMR